MEIHAIEVNDLLLIATDHIFIPDPKFLHVQEYSISLGIYSMWAHITFLRLHCNAVCISSLFVYLERDDKLVFK